MPITKYCHPSLSSSSLRTLPVLLCCRRKDRHKTPQQSNSCFVHTYTVAAVTTLVMRRAVLPRRPAAKKDVSGGRGQPGAAASDRRFPEDEGGRERRHASPSSSRVSLGFLLPPYTTRILESLIRERYATPPLRGRSPRTGPPRRRVAAAAGRGGGEGGGGGAGPEALTLNTVAAGEFSFLTVPVLCALLEAGLLQYVAWPSGVW